MAHWNKNKNCALVVGATVPEQLKEVRGIVGDDMWILLPGIGTQGGDLEASVLNGVNKKYRGIIINSSSGIIFASTGADFADAARQKTQELHDQINAVLLERAKHLVG
jgi:orotidine-5'-phosphate decarboxylase